MKTWFTSDAHLGHENIIKYCNRPFKNVQEMNIAIIKNYNERIHSDDLVFNIGDFCFRNSPGGKKGEGITNKAVYYEKQLNGVWVKLKGNHDRNNTVKTPIERIIIKYGGYRICLVHNPIHVDTRYKLNFVGHVHDKWKFKRISSDSYMINVGVDVWNFKPVNFEEIMKAFRRWKKDNNLNIQPKRDEKDSPKK